MRLLGRVLVALIEVALGWLAVASTEIAASTPVQAELAYTYDTQCSVGLSTHTTTERGPPPTDFNGTTYDPDSLRPLGASVRSDGPGPLGVTTYIDPSGLGRVAQATGTTGGQARYLDGDVSSLSGTRCAANAGRTGARTCLRSFAGTTLVLMADGTRKAIEDVEVGDRVVATDPETGERVTRKVTHVWVHGDQVLDLVAEGEIITTTEDHLFWSVTDQRFERADQLAAGEVVLGDSGRQVIVSGLRLGTARTALAYNLSIVGVHTYHVGQNSILVHNTCPHTPDFGDPSKSPGDGWEWRGPDAPGGSRGAWYNAETRETLHPDLDHPEPIGPHYDWRDPDGVFWRVYPDGTTVPK